MKSYVLAAPRHLAWLTACLLATQPLLPAHAQTNVEGRVTRLEKEMQAVQRKVFPNGAGRLVAPENSAAASAPAQGAAASTPVTDLLARVDAMETQMATLTGQVEQQGNQLRKLEARLAALENNAASAPAPTAISSAPTNPALASPAPISTPPAAKPVAAPAKPATAPAPKPAASASRAAAVAAIEKPATGDAFEDSYSYGYRLWEAKFYPEAQVQLADTVKKFPRHKRLSYARNLLGRAWLDEGKPATSTQIFLDNYQSDPRGDRAPESLYYLGVALAKLKKPKEACQAFDELAAVYPDAAGGRLADRLTRDRAASKCK